MAGLIESLDEIGSEYACLYSEHLLRQQLAERTRKQEVEA